MDSTVQMRHLRTRVWHDFCMSKEGAKRMEEFTFSRVWFITGTSTGFGYLLAEEVLKRGERVIATARDVSKLSSLARQYPDRIHTLTLDVTNPTCRASNCRLRPCGHSRQ